MPSAKATRRRCERLQRKADVNTPQVDGATALHWAVYRDDLDADLLLAPASKSTRRIAKASRRWRWRVWYGNVSMITVGQGR
jgi:ankyrin repeat protein